MEKEKNSQNLIDLFGAVRGMNLSKKETRFLEWLSGWEQDSVYSFISLIEKARAEGYFDRNTNP